MRVAGRSWLAAVGMAGALGAVGALSGCGSPGGTGCDFREGSANGPEDRCQERLGLQGLPVFGATCEALEGAVIEGGCPREGAVVGCILEGSGGDVIDWYYEPMTAAEAEAECEGEGELIDP